MFLDEIFPTPIWGTDLKLDLDSIMYWAYLEKEKDEGRLVSNVGGWQSNDYKEFDRTPLKPLVEAITKMAAVASNELGIPEPADSIVNLWVNINPRLSYNQVHVHPECKLSGVFYVKADENAGNLCFTRGSNDFALGTIAPNMTRYSNAEYEYTPIPNRLIIFPAWVMHHVKANLSFSDRISLSFNLR
jgi:uncharacterized protein (TIGR02466 family)